ncbi:hypothetical protein EMPS_00228 [Entomortierella parvispora]|uniref:F-box domain-containing protein n=1 Tax=Entomortierella parvispora TaxID=205924 RepID=A0A9P3LRN8_9FUNG|nr:hypothetical protein EMPS_00228 [Entomortierella parvispora]
MDSTPRAIHSNRLQHLPIEILFEVFANVSSNEYPVLLEVSKAWHSWFADRIWNSIHVTLSAQRQILIQGADTGSSFRATTSFAVLNNLHRIRNLRVSYDALLVMMREKDVWPKTEKGEEKEEEGEGTKDRVGTGEEAHMSLGDSMAQTLSLVEAPLPHLEQLQVDFNHSESTPDKSTPLNLGPFLDILKRSLSLQSLSVKILKHCIGWEPECQAQLLMALPPSLERLTLDYEHLYPTLLSEQVHNTEERLAALSLVIEGALSQSKGRAHYKLKSLTLFGPRVNMVEDLYTNFLSKQSFPSLDELHISFRRKVDIPVPLSPCICELISKGCRQGWKTLGFKGRSRLMNSSIVAAIFDQCPTLENFRIEMCTEFNSSQVQKLLFSSPKLKRLDVCPRSLARNQSVEESLMLASDIDNDWVCLGLESFRCLIGGIPRPDVRTGRYDNEPLESDLHVSKKYTMQQSRQVQEKILA